VTVIDQEKLNTQLISLIDQVEKQQRLIGELQARLHHAEEQSVELDNKVFEMRTLLQSGKGFSQILDLQKLLDAFMSVCRERYSSINSAVLLRDDLEPEQLSYRVRACFGIPPLFRSAYGDEEIFMFRIPRDQGLLWQLIHQGNVFAVRDLRKLPRFESAFRNWNLNVLQSDVWVPLIKGAEVIGILTLGECEDGSQIAESNYSFLEEIAAVAATNIDSTLKYEKNTRILQNLRTLYDVNQQLTNVNDFKHLAEETLETAVRALSAQKANLMLLNPETGCLEIKLVHGDIPDSTVKAINSGSLSTRVFEVGEGVAGRAAQTRRPVRINDRGRIDQSGPYPVYCILSVPILYGKTLEGVLTITNRVKRNGSETELDPMGRFGEDDEQLLMSLADQAAANLNKSRLYSTSITDRLTGLFNARHFENRFSELLSRSVQAGSNLILGIVDIDHFKAFNDTYGHRAGDLILAQTARLLQEVASTVPRCECFRYGGEEFCVLLPDGDMAGAVALLQTFRVSAAQRRYEWAGGTIGCTVSLGVASSGDFNHGVSLFEAADQALYASKEGGRNRVSVRHASGIVTLPSEEEPKAPQSV